jgi:hypothetical protein
MPPFYEVIQLSSHHIEPDISLEWGGGQFAVSWNHNVGVLYFARISSSGDKIGSDVRVSNSSIINWGPSLVWTGSEFGVSWNNFWDGSTAIHFARIGTGCPCGDPFRGPGARCPVKPGGRHRRRPGPSLTLNRTRVYPSWTRSLS